MSDKSIVRIILIDDDHEFQQTFSRDASAKRIIVKSFLNAEEGLAEIKSSKDLYCGVVLDVKGLKDKQSKIPDPSYFSNTLYQIKQIASDLFVYGITGETDSKSDWSKMFQHDVVISAKEEKDIESLLSQIKQDSQKQPNMVVMNTHRQAFLKGPKVLSNNELNLLLSCIKEIEKSDEPSVIRNLASLRNIIEAIIKKLNAKSEKIVPTDLIKNGVEFRPIMRHLRENLWLDSQNDYIYKLLDTVYTCTSNFGSHSPNATGFGKIYRKADNNTVKMCLYATIELIIWASEVQDKGI